MQISLRGEASCGGTLTLPLLGIFDADCFLLTFADPFTGGDPQAAIRLPPAGHFTSAATAYPAYGFSGSESGPRRRPRSRLGH